MSNKIKSSKAKKGKVKGKDLQNEAFKEILEYCVAAFTMILCVFVPLYLYNGYSNVGESKFAAYKWIAGVGLVLLSLLGIAYWVGRGRKFDDKYSSTDICCGSFLILCLVSAIAGGNFSDCVWGYPGWYMGIIAQLTFVLIYFFISRFGRFDKAVLYVFVAVTSIVFLIGILHKLMIDPIDTYWIGTEYELTDYQKNNFLSTMGQVSWYSSFVATVLPLVLGLFWYSEKKSVRIFTGIVSMLGFMTLTSQNSDSAYMALAGFMIVFFWFSAYDVNRMERFWELSFMFAVSTRINKLLLIIHPNEILELDTFSNFMINNNIMWLITVVFGIIWAVFFFVLKKKNIHNVKLWKVLRVVVLASVLLVIFVSATIIVLSATGNTPDWLAEKTAGISYFNWNEEWGNKRGRSWTVNNLMFKEMPLVNKIFGVGPDGYASFAYSHYGDTLDTMFPGLVLCNGHNEWMNAVISYGILGAIAYLGIFVTSIRNFVKVQMENPILVGFIACTVSYLAHNFFCYQQVCCTPFLIIIIGYGAYLCRKKVFEEKTEKQK